MLWFKGHITLKSLSWIKGGYSWWKRSISENEHNGNSHCRVHLLHQGKWYIPDFVLLIPKCLKHLKKMPPRKRKSCPLWGFFSKQFQKPELINPKRTPKTTACAFYILHNTHFEVSYMLSCRYAVVDSGFWGAKGSKNKRAPHVSQQEVHQWSYE